MCLVLEYQCVCACCNANGAACAKTQCEEYYVIIRSCCYIDITRCVDHNTVCCGCIDFLREDIDYDCCAYADIACRRKSTGHVDQVCVVISFHSDFWV